MKIARKIAVLIFVLFLLSLYSRLVVHVERDGSLLGPLSNPLKSFVMFPTTVWKVFKQVDLENLPPTYIRKDPSFKEFNNLKKDLFSLNSVWNIESMTWDVELSNLRTDDIIHTWNVQNEGMQFNQGPFDRSPPRHSMLLDDQSIIVQLAPSTNLMKLDKESNVIWMNQERVFHHSMEMDHNDLLWLTTWPVDNGEVSYKAIRNPDGNVIRYLDDHITQIDPEKGSIIFDKSVSSILIENGLRGLLFGPELVDPIHLNDIQPALDSSEFWEIGDLFLSLRNRAVILQYRPSSNEVVRVIGGPFINQHDVDIISDSQLTIYSNNHIHDYQVNTGYQKSPSFELVDSLSSIEIYVYDFKSNTYSLKFDREIKEARINSPSEGLSHMLSDGSLLIEEQNAGRIYVLDETGIIYQKYHRSHMEGIGSLPNWSRTYENHNF